MITRIKGIVFMIIVVLLVGIVLPMANTASVQASTAFASFDPADLGGINIGAGVINSPDAWLAQTFFCATQDHEINRVDLYLERDGNPGDVTVSIKAVDTNGHPTGPDLTSSTIAGDNIPTSTDWVQIDLAPYYLSYGNPYAVVVRATNAAESDKLFWYGDLDEGLACGAGLGSLNNGNRLAVCCYRLHVYSLW